MQLSDKARRLGVWTLAIPIALGLTALSVLEAALAAAIPERCAGYGELQRISLTDWETGLGAWTPATRNVANPATFNTADWAPADSLPDGRAGSAAFVENLDSACSAGDESGVLTLTSPPIVIPGGVAIPRISVKHWFDIESDFDGGNLRISVNGGSYNLVPASAIEITPYPDTLLPALDEFGVEQNTNPLAGQAAFTGTYNSEPSGSWVESRINLLGIADAGDTIRLRFDFGIDSCGGSIGWFVDEVEFYYCPAELPPSNCGNGVINGPEQCDDGNNFIGDGCSNTCQIETGWLCTAPTSPAPVSDYSFEAGTPNPIWAEYSNNPIGTPICEVAVCGRAGGTGPSDGNFWVFLGGIKPFQEGSVSQSIVIPPTVSRLTFDLEIPRCDSPADYFEVLIDGNRELLVDGSSALCGIDGYSEQTVDISPYADGGSHDLEFHSETVSQNGGVSNFFIDAVGLPGDPSKCRRDSTSLTLVKNVINDDGGEALTSDWTLSAAGPSGFSGPGPRVWGGDLFAAGTYDLSETGGPSSYAASSWVCAGGSQLDGDTVAVALEESVTCTITNNDMAPTLTVVNTIVNDSGGTITDPDAFGLMIDGLPTPYNVVQALGIGDHAVSEHGLPGYTAGAWGGDCSSDGFVTLELGQAATCTITHDDVAPTLTVFKTIVNDDDGSIENPDAFGLKVDGSNVLHGVTVAVDAGYHIVSEVGLPGYVPGTWTGDCGAGGDIVLGLAQDATCNITNDDSDRTSLTLIKQVINDNGGTAGASAWTLSASGPSSFSGPGPNVSSGKGILPGTYNLSESASISGYGASSWSCVGGNQTDGDTIVLALDETATCTITSNDLPANLTVVKTIVNNDGGAQTDPDAFGLLLDGAAIFHNTINVVDAGLHLVSEVGLPGYQAGIWGGDCSPDGSIILGLSESATCTISNNDIPPSLTLLNTIVNDNGGTVTNKNTFGLRIDGASVQNGVPKTLKAGFHTVTEVGVPGYMAGAWGGSCNSDGTISLALAQSATCTITNDDIAPSIRVQKNIVNDSGGTIVDPNAFGLKIDGVGVLHDSVNMVDAGSHVVSEDGHPGYVAGAWGGSCAPNGSITLGLAEEATCTITNEDSNNTRLTLVKSVSNNSGGTAIDSNFTLAAAGPSPFSGIGPLVSSGPGLLPGAYHLSESGPPGYTASNWDCGSDNPVVSDTVNIALGERVVCSIINDDIAPKLTVLNTVINNNGGTAAPNDFGLRVDGGAVVHNAPITLYAGNHDVTAEGFPGYLPGTWGGDCSPDGSINLVPGEQATCTIIHDDIAATLRLLKVIDGGDITDPNAFGLKIDGTGVAHNEINSLSAGNHAASEDGLAGYRPGIWTPPCNPDGTITLALAQDATCSITNEFVDITSLTLLKQVINDNGGTALGSVWTLEAAGPSGFNSTGPVVSSGPEFQAGTYELSETGGPSGYSASNWVCVGATINGSSVTLVPGQAATCTVTNNDDDVTNLTLINQVSNNDGGLASPDAWTLGAIGPRQFSGNGPSVTNPPNFSAGIYDLYQSGGPAGYRASDWDCNGGAMIDGDTISLAFGESVSCTITNDDIAPTLKVFKSIINDNGGGVTNQNAFVLQVDDQTVLHNVANTVTAGAHTVSEVGLAGYLPGNWGGDCGPDGSITLSLAETAVCTLTNNDIAPGLTLMNQVTNNNGGKAVAPNWTLTATGPTGFSGPGPAVSSGVGFVAGTYDLSSNGPGEYTSSDWVCSGAGVIQDDADTVTVGLGQFATCTVTHDDDRPVLTLVKEIVNDSGGSAGTADWTLSAAGPTPLSGPGPSTSSGANFKIGIYDLSESGPTGYTASSWVCTGATQNDADTVTLALGQSATCTLTNDDSDASLTLVKQVTNNNGGTATASSWTLSAAGPSPFSGPGPTVPSGNGFKAGTYDLSESGGPNGYAASDWVCLGGTQDDSNTVTVGLGQSVTCTIANNDVAPNLTLVTQITNDNGGTAIAANWSLTASGPTGFSGNGPTVSNGPSFQAGTYNLSQTGPSGYTTGDWVCSGGTQNDSDTVTLLPGESATCTIENNDKAPGLTLNKVVTNDNGGAALASAWTLAAAGPTPFSGPGPSVSNGTGFKVGTYTLSESGGPPGYKASAWNCVGASQSGNQITLQLGQSATCTITNNDEEPSLTLSKQVINNNGGTAAAADWTLAAAGPSPFSGSGPTVSNGTGFKAGTYTLSESGGPTGYDAGDWVCTGGSQVDGNTVAVGLGQVVTCQISNNDAAPSLTLVKEVINNNGGTAVAANWTLTATGPSTLSGAGPSVSNGSGFKIGTYILSESGGPAGYTASAWNCSGGAQNGNQLTLGLGDTATCAITNDDNAASLTLNKVVTNNNGGTSAPSDWTLTASGPTPLSGPGAYGSTDVQSGPNFAAGTYTLSESGPGGYGATAWSCDGGTQNGNQITVGIGQSATCTITNNDNAPSLTLNKVVTNNNGGNAQPSDWTLAAAGPTPISGPGAAGSTDLQSGPTFAAGTYTLSENGGPNGYSASDWNCSGGSQNGNQITLGLGQSASCTITNNDAPPSLTLVKQVTNNNGGNAVAADWTLAAAGPRPFSGTGPSVSNPPNFLAGTYDLSESDGPDGYSASAWNCTAGTMVDADTVSLALGDSATCTIVNDDEGPGLTLVKQVINDNGGTATAADWTLAASGPTGFSGPGPSVSNAPGFVAGTYTLTESGEASGYTASTWVCVGGSQDGNTIQLEPGESATCTITNNDISPSLALRKQVNNDNGGTATTADWTLTAAGPSSFSGPGPDVANGALFKAGTYDLSEFGPAGYTASDWSCTGGKQDDANTITLALGEAATCTITNDDKPPSLTLLKQVTNDDGGTAVAANWTLSANGPSVLSGSGPNVSSGSGFKAGTYDLSESGGPSGYVASSWDCSGGSQDDADTLSLLPGEVATCTIINDDVGPGLTLVKQVTNDNGGKALPSAWTLRASGPMSFSGPGPSVSNEEGFTAGQYDLSESTGPSGYTAGDWACTGGTQNDADTITVAPGEAVTCTITNNDNAPGLTLVKKVINNDGGTASPSAWTLVASGPSPFSGAGPSVTSGVGFKAGTYTLSESGGPDGYSASDWVCTGGSQDDVDTITLELGESATCTITNDDVVQGSVIFNDGFEVK